MRVAALPIPDFYWFRYRTVRTHHQVYYVQQGFAYSLHVLAEHPSMKEHGADTTELIFKLEWRTEFQETADSVESHC